MKNEKVIQTNLIGRSHWRSGLLLILLALAFSSLALSANAAKICQEFCSNNDNTVFGANALMGNAGSGNTAIGDSPLFSNTTGYDNTAVGVQALHGNTNGYDNTAVGGVALATNTTGRFNTGIGEAALGSNTIGSYNTATGVVALENNRSGTYNTANGYGALCNNTSDRNTATGAFALNRNTSGAFNTADGYGALNRNTTGQLNTAAGYGALYFNNADNNSAFGWLALFGNTNGSRNSAFGWGALGFNSGNNNIALGYGAGVNLTAGDNNIDIGNAGAAPESGTIRIGTAGSQTATYVAGIFGATVTEGVGVIVDTNGHLGTAVSSARFKDEIKPMNKASEALFSLNPVTFRYKKELDPVGKSQFGLVAEDVGKVNPDLVVRDKEGNPYSVRYDAVNAMLLNEFLKEHGTVQEQQKEIDVLKAELKQQRALIQKVSAQIELSKPSPRTVLNDRDAGQ